MKLYFCHSMQMLTPSYLIQGCLHSFGQKVFPKKTEYSALPSRIHSVSYHLYYIQLCFEEAVHRRFDVLAHLSLYNKDCRAIVLKNLILVSFLVFFFRYLWVVLQIRLATLSLITLLPWYATVLRRYLKRLTWGV